MKYQSSDQGVRIVPPSEISYESKRHDDKLRFEQISKTSEKFLSCLIQDQI